MPFAGAFALDNLQKYAEMLRQRKLLAEKTAFERFQAGDVMRRGQEGLNIQRETLAGAQDERRLTRERQGMLDQRQRERDAATDAATLFTQQRQMAEDVEPGFIPEGDPRVKMLPPHLLTAQAPRSGADFEGPLQPGQVSPTARSGGFLKGATGTQANRAVLAGQRATDDARLAETQDETVRHNRAMEARPVGGGTSTVLIRDFDPVTGKQTTRVVPRTSGASYESEPLPTADMRNRERSFATAAPVMSSISELSERINTQAGLIAKMSGGVEKAKAQVNYNDDVAEYESIISGFTPLVARAVGHVGVLTEQDVQSVRKLFPTPGDSKTLRDRKIKRLEQIMGGVQSALAGREPEQAKQAGPKAIPEGATGTTKDGRRVVRRNGAWVPM